MSRIEAKTVEVEFAEVVSDVKTLPTRIDPLPTRIVVEDKQGRIICRVLKYSPLGFPIEIRDEVHRSCEDGRATFLFVPRIFQYEAANGRLASCVRRQYDEKMGKLGEEVRFEWDTSNWHDPRSEEPRRLLKKIEVKYDAKSGEPVETLTVSYDPKTGKEINWRKETREKLGKLVEENGSDPETGRVNFARRTRLNNKGQTIAEVIINYDQETGKPSQVQEKTFDPTLFHLTSLRTEHLDSTGRMTFSETADFNPEGVVIRRVKSLMDPDAEQKKVIQKSTTDYEPSSGKVVWRKIENL